MNSQNLLSSRDIWKRKEKFTIKSPRTPERRVNGINSISRADDNNLAYEALIRNMAWCRTNYLASQDRPSRLAE